MTAPMMVEAEEVPRPDTILTRLADATNGWVTPANALDLAGGVVSTYAIPKLDTWEGYFLEYGIARTAVDLGDGPLARATHTASETGAIIDAVKDKGEILGIAFVNLLKHMTPIHEVAVIGLFNLVNAHATIVHKRNGGEDLEPSKPGKHNMGVQNMVFMARNASHILKKDGHESAAATMNIAGDMAFGLSIERSIVAALDYRRQAGLTTGEPLTVDSPTYSNKKAVIGATVGITGAILSNRLARSGNPIGARIVQKIGRGGTGVALYNLVTPKIYPDHQPEVAESA